MKKISVLTFLFFLTIFAFSQQEIQIDKRAYNYYTKEEINSMPINKIKKINFLYKHSFIIPEEFKGQIDPNKIDVRKYSRYRKLHERTKVYLIDDSKTPKGESDVNNLSGKYIYLISIDELRDSYEKIDEGILDVD
jgi:hypothetical protein